MTVQAIADLARLRSDKLPAVFMRAALVLCDISGPVAIVLTRPNRATLIRSRSDRRTERKRAAARMRLLVTTRPRTGAVAIVIDATIAVEADFSAAHLPGWTVIDAHELIVATIPAPCANRWIDAVHA